MSISVTEYPSAVGINFLFKYTKTCTHSYYFATQLSCESIFNVYITVNCINQRHVLETFCLDISSYMIVGCVAEACQLYSLVSYI